MPTYGVAYSFTRGLYDARSPGQFRVNPTIAVGDFTISKDGGAFVPLTSLPVVSPAGSRLVLFQLTAAEMTAAHLTVQGIDQAGAEWTEFMEHVEPTAAAVHVPTAVEVADAVLLRDWSLVAGPPPAYSIWNALRMLRNAWTILAGTPPVLHVFQEDGLSEAWNRTLTTSAQAFPITGTGAQQ